MKGTLDEALKLHPDTRRVVVIGGTSKADQFREAAARKVFQGIE